MRYEVRSNLKYSIEVDSPGKLNRLIRTCVVDSPIFIALLLVNLATLSTV